MGVVRSLHIGEHQVREIDVPVAAGARLEFPGDLGSNVDSIEIEWEGSCFRGGSASFRREP